jgi:hypothetical protein
MASLLTEMLSTVKLIQANSNDFADAQLPVLLQLFREMRAIVGKLGILFNMATSDIDTKCDFVNEFIHANNLVQGNVQILIVFEKSHGNPMTGATRRLIPLIRSLELVGQLLRRIHVDKTELGESIRNAYWESIYQYHTFVVAQAVAAATYSAPYKKDFFASLNTTEEDAKDCCVELSALLLRLHAGLKSLCIQEKCWDTSK